MNGKKRKRRKKDIKRRGGREKQRVGGRDVV
jgi:hypothetical protein